MLAPVYFAGVDLAWGERNPTGVAVVDADGLLVRVGAAGDDDDIVAQLAPYVAGDCVVAIDAPLVVTNASGIRECEVHLNRDFRKYDAGAYPANTGLPWFADGGRGGRLCKRLHLNLDPRSQAPRRAFEVFPHAASVALFELPKTLKYKQKSGRDFAQLQSELLRLTGLIEGLEHATPALHVSSHPGWRQLIATVRDATRKADLRRAEDPIDSVLCAYVAQYAANRPRDVTIYGQAPAGCIVTPTLTAPRST